MRGEIIPILPPARSLLQPFKNEAKGAAIIKENQLYTTKTHHDGAKLYMGKGIFFHNL